MLFTKFKIFNESLILEGAYDNYEKHYSKTKLTLQDFEQIVKADPTSMMDDGHDKMGKYSKWLINLYLKGGLKLEDLYKATQYLTVFEKYKSKLEVKDINKVISLPGLFNIVEEYIDSDEPASNREAEKKAKESAEKFYEDDNTLILIPKTHEAACYYGKGTQWCTASKDDDYYFNSYTKDGNLYIIILKNVIDDEGRQAKYQLHLGSEQFMDYRDDEAYVADVLSEKQFKKIVENERLDWITLNNSEDMAHEDMIKFVKKFYCEPSSSRRDYISEETILNFLNDGGGYYGDFSDDLKSIFRYYIIKEQEEQIKSAMISIVTNTEDPEDLIDDFDNIITVEGIREADNDDLIKWIDDVSIFDDLKTNIENIYRWASETEYYNNFWKAIKSAIMNLDEYHINIKDCGLPIDEDDAVENGYYFTVEEPHYGFDSSPSQELFNSSFKDNFEF